MRVAFVAAALLFAFPAVAAPFDADMSKDMPADVSAFLDREGMCWHWAGEEAYDAARGKEIARSIAGLKCDLLGKDEAALRQKHQGEPAVLKRLTTAKAAYQ